MFRTRYICDYIGSTHIYCMKDIYCKCDIRKLERSILPPPPKKGVYPGIYDFLQITSPPLHV